MLHLRPLNIKTTFIHLKTAGLSVKRKFNLPIQSCVCGQLYLNNKRHRQFEFIRVHSTQSDHRQKVVIETTTPNIIDKLGDYEKVLPQSKHELRDWRSRIDPYVKLARWDRPIGVYLLYWPCAWSIALASIPGTVPLQTSLSTAALFAAGAGLMRGAGCTINDLWDRDIDKQVERTKDRPLVSGAVTPRRAFTFLAAQLALALGILLQLNCYSVLLGASSMLLVVTYPLAKRYTNYPQVFLGATFNWGALLGYSAVQGSAADAVCLPLYAAALCWTLLYDTIYAHQDKIDDARIGIKSTALTFGRRTKPALYATLCVSAACFAASGSAAGLDWPFALGLAAYLAHATTQIYTLNVDDPTDCAKKFKSNSFVGFLILLGILGGGYSQYIDNRKEHRGKEDLSITKSCVFG